MQTRIVGIETEFGLSFAARSGRRISPEELARILFKPVVAWGRSSNVFLANGSRLYLDVGSHPEYATAECSTLAELIAQERAGERIVSDLAAQASQTLEAEGYDGDVYLFKNNVDSVGNSYGSHENYLIKRSLELHRLSAWLVPLLVTRPLIAGAGGFVQGERGPRFVLSPRAEHLWEPVSSSTTRSRPMINTRDEPHADAQRYRRLHVISGDSSMAEPTVLLKMGTVCLVLRMLEAGRVLPDVSIANPLRGLREVSLGAGAPVSLDLADGRTATALEVQRMFLEQAGAFCEAEGATAEEKQVLALWERVLDDLEQAEPGEDGGLAATGAALRSSVDWAAKKGILDAYAARDGLKPGDPRLSQLDLAYHDVKSGRGLASILERSGRLERIVGEEDIRSAMDRAPSTTRAALRGRFLAEARAADTPVTVDWMNLRVNARPDLPLALKDPFETDPARIEPLLELIRGR